MSITWAPGFSDVEVCEVHGSIKENVGRGFESASVDLMCDWADRHDVVAAIVGARLLWPHAGDYIRVPYATSAGIKPLDSKPTTDGQGLIYEKAIVSVNYSYSDGEDPETLMSESLEPTAEFLTLDYRRFAWAKSDDSEAEDGLTEGEAPGKLMRGLNIVRTLYKVTSVPSQVLSCYGHVNQAGYTSSLLGLTFPAETLLYCPPTMDRTFTTDGSEGFDIQLKFQYKGPGWNKYWRAKTKTWARLWDLETDTVYNSYPTADFSALLY